MAWNSLVAVPQEADKDWRGPNTMHVRVPSNHCQLRRTRGICATGPPTPAHISSRILPLADSHPLLHSWGPAASLSWSHCDAYGPSAFYPHLPHQSVTCLAFCSLRSSLISVFLFKASILALRFLSQSVNTLPLPSNLSGIKRILAAVLEKKIYLCHVSCC